MDSRFSTDSVGLKFIAVSIFVGKKFLNSQPPMLPTSLTKSQLRKCQTVPENLSTSPFSVVLAKSKDFSLKSK